MTRVVILNADDYGYEPNVSRGIEEAMSRGVVSSTTMMVNTPFLPESGSPFPSAIGLHLNLARFPSVHDPKHEFVEGEVSKLTVPFVAEEVRAQLDRLKALVGTPATHIDVHKHLHLQPNVLEGVIQVALERGLPVRSINAHMRQTLKARGVKTNDAFLGDAGSTAYWTLETWERVLDEVPATGVTELMCHPGYAPTQLTSGYGAQREVELATFVSPRAREALTKRGIALTSWRDV